MLVNQIMSQNLHTVLADDNLGLLLKTFDEVNYHHLPVTDKDKNLLGIISDRDVISHVSPFIDTDFERECDRELLRQTAADIMSTKLVTVMQTSPIKEASILLLENNFSCLPVVDENGKIEGLLTWKDILNYHLFTA